MERRRGLLGERQCIAVDGGPETRAMLTAAQAGAEGAFGNKDPFAACAPFVEHAAVIDGEPQEGTGQAGPPSDGSSSFCRDGVDISLRAFHDFAALQPGLEPCEIEMDDQAV